MNLRELGDSFFCDNMKKFVSDEPYMSFVIMSAIVEFIGKCMKCREDFSMKGCSKQDFCHAINNLEELSKYKVFNTENSNHLYDHLRCGMVHSMIPQSDVVLSDSSNNLKEKIVGAKDFYSDLQRAWEEIQQNNSIGAYLSKKKAVDINNNLTGSTLSNI